MSPPPRELRLNPLAPRRRPGATDEEARLAGVLPPLGHVVPPAPWADRLLTPWRLARAIARFLVRRHHMGPSGSASLRAEFTGLLATLGVGLRVRGEDRLCDGGHVLMWNQTSHLDHLLLAAAIPVPFRSVFNLEVAKVPGYGPWLRSQGHLLVDRFDEAQWRRSLGEAAAWVREGNTLLVSPEGTRSWDGRLLPMKRGAFLVAVDSGRPIVPVLVRGAHACLPRGRFAIARGEIDVSFLEAIPTAGYAEDTRAELQAKVAGALGDT
jgi:1-acyl-sn-glycerol-3-phosphate acyltransferase